ncbi:MAG: two pore domain potassium channel family protein [Lentisphaerae bacterium]|nr:two pore domain potassium channel family protein [Lentisphaerota bacterium]MCP4103676.1 two pore domain potassium channel family protein [Lentisphaerota bacterium]
MQIRKFLKENKCAVVTALLVMYLLADPFIRENFENVRTVYIGYYLFLIFTPYFLTSSKRVLVVSLIYGLSLNVLKVIFEPGVSQNELETFYIVIGTSLVVQELLLLLVVIGYTCTRSFSSREPIFGSILAYLLTAVFFGDAFYIVSHIDPGSFAAAGQIFQPMMKDTYYFSFATITTCGYGDVRAVSMLARRMASFEAVFGVLYVAVFIGRVISMFTAHRLHDLQTAEVPHEVTRRGRRIRYR